MSEPEQKKSTSESDTTTDEEIDYASDSFDPLKALYSPKLKLAKGPLSDNVEKFASSLKQTSSSQSKSSSKTSASTSAPTPTRQFLPEQMPVTGKRKECPNLIKYMNKHKEGPMHRLQQCVQEGQRVRVVTRRERCVRGHCTGVLIAFDRHWNLALLDVDETFTRKRTLKTPVCAKSTEIASDSENKDKEEQVGTSFIRVIKRRRKNELCERHVPQVVLRGEHVVSLSIL